MGADYSTSNTCHWLLSKGEDGLACSYLGRFGYGRSWMRWLASRFGVGTYQLHLIGRTGSIVETEEFEVTEADLEE